MNKHLWRQSLVINLAIAGVLLLFLLAGSAMAESAGVETGAEAADGQARTWEDAARAFAAALTMGMAAFATALAQARIGTAGVGALAENPKLFGNLLIFLVIPETIVILGFVIAALMIF